MLRRFQSTYTAIRMDMIELSSVQQVGALKEGLIDIGFGRLHVDDTAVRREILLEEPLVAALPIGHPLLEHAGPLPIQTIVSYELILIRRNRGRVTLIRSCRSCASVVLGPLTCERFASCKQPWALWPQAPG